MRNFFTANLILLFILLTLIGCNQQKDKLSENQLKKLLVGDWILSKYCDVIRSTKSPKLAVKYLNRYFEMSYNPHRSYSFNPVDSSYWMFIDSSRFFIQYGRRINFDTLNSSVIVYSTNKKDTIGKIVFERPFNQKKCEFIFNYGDTLTFEKYSDLPIRGSAISYFTNKEVLPDTFEIDLPNMRKQLIYFSADGYAHNFSKLFGYDKYNLFGYSLIPVRDDKYLDERLYLSNPLNEHSLSMHFRWRRQNDSIIFTDCSLFDSTKWETVILKKKK